nr:hypothetical protein GCM10020093_049500 [Planobispora longispora]
MGELKVPPATGDTIPSGPSGLDRAVLAHADAHEWFTRLLGRPARLIRRDDPAGRTVTEESRGLWDGPSCSSPGVRSGAWTTGSPKAPWNAGSAPGPLDIARFRPNAVIDGAEPFAEDAWTSVRIGGIDFRVSELCDRCAATVWDPSTQDRGKEPLRTLAGHRRWDGKTWFGLRLAPENLGELRVGDEVRPG